MLTSEIMINEALAKWKFAKAGGSGRLNHVGNEAKLGFQAFMS